VVYSLNYNIKYVYNIWTGRHISLSWFSCRSSILIELGFGNVGFSGGRKTGEPGEKLSEQGENQQQTQPTCGTGPESNPGHIGAVCLFVEARG